MINKIIESIYLSIYLSIYPLSIFFYKVRVNQNRYELTRQRVRVDEK